jgi:hypothetical protein
VRRGCCPAVAVSMASSRTAVAVANKWLASSRVAGSQDRFVLITPVTLCGARKSSGIPAQTKRPALCAGRNAFNVWVRFTCCRFSFSRRLPLPAPWDPATRVYRFLSQRVRQRFSQEVEVPCAVSTPRATRQLYATIFLHPPLPPGRRARHKCLPAG